MQDGKGAAYYTHPEDKSLCGGETDSENGNSEFRDLPSR